MPSAFLYAFEQSSGEIAWSTAFAGGVATDIRRHQDAAVAVAASAEIAAFDLTSGMPLWTVDDPPDRARGTRTGDPALVDGMLYVPWRPGIVDALDVESGERTWRQDLGAEISTSAVVVTDRVVVGTVDGRLRLLTTTDGEPDGDVELSGSPYGDLVLGAGCLLVLVAEGELVGGSFGGPHALVCIDPGRWRRALAIRLRRRMGHLPPTRRRSSDRRRFRRSPVGTLGRIG